MPKLALKDLQRSSKIARAMPTPSVEAGLHAQHLRAECQAMREACRLRRAYIKSRGALSAR